MARGRRAGSESGTVDRARESVAPWRSPRRSCRLGQCEVHVLVVVEGQEPVPYVPERDSGCLADPGVFDERLGLALSIMDRLEDQPLIPPKIRAMITPWTFRASQVRSSAPCQSHDH